VAGNNTLVLPSGNGSAGNILGTDGAGNLSWVNGRMVLETAKATTSGTAIDFTGIPSWVKRITVTFNGVSTNGADPLAIQLGTSAGIVTAAGQYNCGFGYIASNGTAQGITITNCFMVTTNFTGGAGNLYYGNVLLINISNNNWVMTCTSGTTSGSFQGASTGGGSISLPGQLDRLRFSTQNGTNTFDAGSVNILYEG
jgi:hypothetical protein